MRGNADIISATLPASIPSVVLVLLQSYLEIVNDLDAEIKLLEGRNRESLATKSRDFQIITSIPVIKFIGASTLIAEIGNVHDFQTADKLTKWAGLTPTVYQSANVIRTVRLPNKDLVISDGSLLNLPMLLSDLRGGLNRSSNGLCRKKDTRKLS